MKLIMTLLYLILLIFFYTKYNIIYTKNIKNEAIFIILDLIIKIHKE